MKKSGILNNKISMAISSLGHKDLIVVCDAGFPIPKEVERIDVAVGKNIPRFLETVKVISKELCVEKIIIANELNKKSETYRKLLSIFSGIDVDLVSHDELKNISKKAKAVIRTGEFTPYANVILVSGVVF